jgi:hypothetical protein
LLIAALVVTIAAVAAFTRSGSGASRAAQSTNRTSFLTTTTSASTATAPALVVVPRTLPAGVNARVLLDETHVESDHKGGYQRALFGADWSAQPDCLNTRSEVLARDSETEPVQTKCKVTSGSWTSPYDAQPASDPAALQIDHLVPLKEAWDSGAWAWTAPQRLAFANDLGFPHALIAVTAALNTAKGDRDPSNWLPPLESVRCHYVSWWTAEKWRWNLTMDQSEWGRIKNIMASCPPNALAVE